MLTIWHVQPLLDHHKPRTDLAPVPRRQSLRRQPRNDNDALGYAAASTSRWILRQGRQHYSARRRFRYDLTRSYRSINVLNGGRLAAGAALA